MRKMLPVLIMQFAVLLAQAGGEAVLSVEGLLVDFNSFAGSAVTLPDGVTVSKTGQDAMLPDDADYRGVSTGGVTTGGCYAWDTGAGDRALGYQPTEEEFTPGYFQVAVSNATGVAFLFLKVEFEVVCLNNADRASSLKLMLAVNGVDFLPVDGMEYVTTQTQDSGPKWSRVKMQCYIKLNSPLPAGGTFALRWVGADAGGSGSRDEYGLSSIAVKGIKSRGFVLTVR